MKSLTIIMYHYVRPIKKSLYPLIKGLELDAFKMQLSYLDKNYKIITMESLIEFVKNDKPLPKNPCLLTFDDGYKDHYSYVFPELKKRGIQGSFFPPAKGILEKKVLDVHKIHFILAKTENTNLLISDIKKLLEDCNKAENKKLHDFNYLWKKYAVADSFDNKEIIFIKRILQHVLPNTIRDKFCNILFKRYMDKEEKEFAVELYMSKEELKEMIRSKMYVGCHGYDHLWLNTLSKSSQLQEIEKGLNFLNRIGAPTVDWVMNYPYGVYNSNTLKILKIKNCCIGLTTKSKTAQLVKDKFFELPRFDTNDIKNLN